MFTGIVETKTHVKALEAGLLCIANPWDQESLKLGQSISVSGCCLTISRFSATEISFEISPETFSRTFFQDLASGDWVNVERGMRLGDRLDGHLVTGHVDTKGHLLSREKSSDEKCEIWRIGFPSNFQTYLIDKGSICVDGVSLTVNKVYDDAFVVTIIPHTLERTSFESYKTGRALNLEFDLVAKFIEKQTLRARENTL